VASKKDLVEAQTFSRRRLLTAFVSGAPGGRELEPTKPMRAVATGIGLSALVVIGSLAFGMLKPNESAGWQDNALVITPDGARYVSADGTLYPVLNTASARLVLTGGLKDPAEVTNEQIADAPRGPTVGIPGAPDALPEPEDLVGDGWLSCVSSTGGTTTWLSSGDEMASVVAGVKAEAADGGAAAGVLVESGGDEYLVAEGQRYRIPGEWRDAVLRALDPEGAQVWPVSATWLGLFTPGSDLEPFELEDVGDPLDDPGSAPEGAVVGSVLSITDAGEGDPAHFVINKDGTISPISGLGLEMYRIAQGGATDIEETLGSTHAMPNADPIAPADWPGDVPEMVGDDLAACARLSTAAVAEDSTTPVMLVGGDVPTPEDGSAQVVVDPAGGALVVPVAGTMSAQGTVQLIDATGTAFPVPDAATGDVLSRLGYLPEEVTAVPQAWLALFEVGPELTPAAAGQSYEGAAGSADATDPGGEPCSTDEPALIPDEPAAVSRLGARAAWELATGRGVVVAVVDSGVDVRNVHLSDDVVLEGVDLVSEDGDPRGWTDVAGHGTAIAGQIAARTYSSNDGSSGLIGLAPEAQILPVRVYVSTDQQDVDAGLGPRSDRVAAGIRYAADHGAQIINVSLSFTEDVPELADAVAYATEQGALVVASAGNRETSEDKTDSPRYPAAYPEVLAVAAVDETDAPTDSSIHGDHVEIAALGSNVHTSFLGLADCVLGGSGAPSFATGYVSGAAALLAERYPDESPQEWAYRLTVTAARARADVRSPDVGWGVVRPWAALAFVDDGTALGPDSPTHERPGDAVEPPAPVMLTAQADTLARARSSSLWWVLGGAAALMGAVLVSFPALRGRRRGNPAGPASAPPR
jgi:type VII secretion-associated serine protease mycosin/type VII secretion protein EccB